MPRHRSPRGGRSLRGRSATARHRAATVRRGMSAAALGSVLAAVVPPGMVAIVEADAEVTPLASIAPVRDLHDRVPPEATTTRLIKAAGLADVARRAEEALAARRAAAGCAADTSSLGPVKPWAREAARFLSCLYDHPALLGVGLRGGVSDHPTGHAVDLMTSTERGDRIAACALANQRELGISYVIWKQRINFGDGDGWHLMADRGSATENHYDHVHLSFEKRPPSAGSPDPTRCG